ncbi:hypothetical protein [Bradyrhizobium guangzhouense]|uniref:Uncharacterized protein n=1 Tax=Bradyrhizobium guangzhouense TaxID=1325095 RepID=A0AAE5X569_9BRAD|nr:hypothetical protein [Bradyrhizobium guangzhouense]QAU48846.1 hypothetical protein XH91_28150 [Bradyrhizobium guangzhouense]
MLVVTIEVHPAGIRALRRTVGALRIGNVSDLASISDYRVFAMQSANPLTGEAAGAAEFMVLGHDRRQQVWPLLRRACEEAMKADWVEF